MPEAAPGLTIEEVAQHALGFRQLRPGQRDAVQAVLAGNDTLVVMPTGSGKSAIYQLAGAMTGGPTVVVSPLIALQRDQVASMGRRLGVVSEVNSSMTESRREEALEDLAGGQLDYVFLAPEQLANPGTLEQVRRGHPSLLRSTRLIASTPGGTTSGLTT